MNDDDALNDVSLFLSIMAYAGGNWSPDDVIQAYEYVKKTSGKVRMSLVKDFNSSPAAPGGEIH